MDCERAPCNELSIQKKKNHFQAVALPLKSENQVLNHLLKSCPKSLSTGAKQNLTARRLQTIKYSISSASISHTDVKENSQT